MEKKKMKIISGDELGKDFFGYRELEEIEVVKRILKDVKSDGDAAVKKYAEKFDNIKGDSFEVSEKEINEAYNKVDKETIDALKQAAENIRNFAIKQFA